MIFKQEAIILETVDSTNDYLLRGEFESGTVVLAREQTKGKGRRGRTWISTTGDSLMFSALWKTKVTESIALLPLIVGYATIDALKTFLANQSGLTQSQNDLKIKWPNDIYLGDAKLGGCLIESVIQGEEQLFAIGIGLNWRGSPPIVENRKTVCLFGSGPAPVEFVGPLVASLNSILSWAQGVSNKDIVQKIEENSILKNRAVMLGEEKIVAICVTERGGLLIRHEDGSEEEIIDTDREIFL